MNRMFALSSVLMIFTIGTVRAQSVLLDNDETPVIVSENVAELLRGQVAGVHVGAIDNNPNGALNVNIRGLNSLRTDNQPLWIVDGVMLSSDINQNLDAFWQFGERSYTAPLNPLASLSVSEIETIEVLKNASATAIYGTRGANGVIIIKTKTGREGRKDIDWSTNIKLNTNSSFKSVPTFSHNHHLSVNGGGNKTNYKVSADFRNVNGVTPRNGSNYGMINARFDTYANNIIWFGLNANISIGKTSNPTGTAYLGAPSYMLALRDKTLSPYTTAQQWLNDYDDDSMDYRGLVSTYLRFNILKNLHLELNGGFDLQSNDRIIWYGINTDLGAISVDNPNGGAASNLASDLFNYNANASLDYKIYFKNNHLVYIKALGEVLGNRYHFNTMNGINMVSHHLRGKGLNIRGSLPLNHIFRHEYFHIGAYGLLRYSWDNKVTFDGTFRYDWTPKYGELCQSMYPSVEMAVDIRKIAFPKYDIVSSLMLKGGYGISGREQYIPYEKFGKYLSGKWMEPESGQEAFCDGVDLLRTSEWHITLEAGLINDRVGLALTYYDRFTSDLFSMYNFASDPVVTTKGTFYKWLDVPDLAFDRASEIANRGFELSIDAIPVKNSDWTWTLALCCAFNANQMVSSNADDYYGRAVGQDIFCSFNVVGAPISSLYGYLSDNDGNYIDTTGEGRVTRADKTMLGNTIPKYHGGFETSLRWRDLCLNISLNGAAGHQIANINNMVRDGVVDSFGDIVLSSKYVEDADYIRINHIGVNYNVPIKLKWLKELNVGVAVKNLAVMTKYSGWNPDVNSFGVNSLSNGFDYGSYPMSKSFVLGVTAKF